MYATQATQGGQEHQPAWQAYQARLFSQRVESAVANVGSPSLITIFSPSTLQFRISIALYPRRSRATPSSISIDIRRGEGIDFRASRTANLLQDRPADAISQGSECLVLKGCGDPYFSFDGSVRQIKLEKNYIPGLGDSADMAVVGRRRDARDEYAILEAAVGRRRD